MSSNFFKEKSFEDRKKETDRMKLKYPDRIFIYLEKQERCKLPEIDKNKFLVPKDLTVGQMIHIIRKRIKISSSQGIYLFTEKNDLPMSCQTVDSLYKSHGNIDGFLYLKYNTEEVYG